MAGRGLARAGIRHAITSDALVFIACFSSSSLSRERSYQNEELVLAIEQSRQRQAEFPWLIPVRFDDCVIPDLDIGGGRTLASIQRADLFGDQADEHTARLIETVQRILGQRSTDPALKQGPPAAPAAGTTARNRPPTLAATADASQLLVIRLLDEAVKAAYADPGNSFRAVTIAQIATIMAAHDPDRAARLLADAERCAKAIPEISKKAAAIADVAAIAVVTDKRRAARLAAEAEHAQSDADIHLQRYVQLQSVRLRSGRADPIRLAPGDFGRLTEASNNEVRRPKTLARVAEVLAATDPDRAERIARGITAAGQQVTTLARIAKVVAAADPDRAARLIADAEHAAHAISDQDLKIECLANLAATLTAADPDCAARLAAGALRVADTLSRPELTDWNLADIAGALAGTDAEYALQTAEAIRNPELKAQVIAGVAETAAPADPDRTERIAQMLTMAEWKAYALAAIAQAVADNDLDRAARLAADAERTAEMLPDSDLKHATLARVAHVIAAGDPDRAEHIALTIADQRWKARALTRVADTITTTHKRLGPQRPLH